MAKGSMELRVLAMRGRTEKLSGKQDLQSTLLSPGTLHGPQLVLGGRVCKLSDSTSIAILLAAQEPPCLPQGMIKVDPNPEETQGLG